MTRYAALLRGIGPANPNMSNEKLRGVFSGLDLEDVASVLASGNIVFGSAESDVPGLEERIQQALHRELGIAGGTILRSHAELRALVDSDPFPGLTHGPATYLTATFLKDGARGPERPPEQLDPSARLVRYDEDARVYLAVVDNREPIRVPHLMTWLDKTYGKGITTRSWQSVHRIVRKLQS